MGLRKISGLFVSGLLFTGCGILSSESELSSAKTSAQSSIQSSDELQPQLPLELELEDGLLISEVEADASKLSLSYGSAYQKTGGPSSATAYEKISSGSYGFAYQRTGGPSSATAYRNRGVAYGPDSQALDWSVALNKNDRYTDFYIHSVVRGMAMNKSKRGPYRTTNKLLRLPIRVSANSSKGCTDHSYVSVDLVNYKQPQKNLNRKYSIESTLYVKGQGDRSYLTSDVIVTNPQTRSDGNAVGSAVSYELKPRTIAKPRISATAVKASDIESKYCKVGAFDYSKKSCDKLKAAKKQGSVAIVIQRLNMKTCS